MSKSNAKAYYLGQKDKIKLNCAQAVIKAFQDKFKLDEKLVVEFEKYGRGNAPQGDCGALYAAQAILERQAKGEVAERCGEFFRSNAGFTKCKDIRAAGRLSCVGCVETASIFLENL